MNLDTVLNEHRDMLSDEEVKQGLEFPYEPVQGSMVKNPKTGVKRFVLDTDGDADSRYKHYLVKKDLDRRIVEAIRKNPEYDGEAYLHSWYAANGCVPWNKGKGYVTGIVIDVKAFERVRERTALSRERLEER